MPNTFRIGQVFKAKVHHKGRNYEAIIQLEEYVQPNWDFKVIKPYSRFKIKVLSGEWPYTTISANNLRAIKGKRDKTAEILYKR